MFLRGVDTPMHTMWGIPNFEQMIPESVLHERLSLNKKLAI